MAIDVDAQIDAAWPGSPRVRAETPLDVREHLVLVRRQVAIEERAQRRVQRRRVRLHAEHWPTTRNPRNDAPEQTHARGAGRTRARAASQHEAAATRARI